jgi:hypothetical protein
MSVDQLLDANAGVDLRGIEFFMPEDGLESANVGAAIVHQRGHGVTIDVAGSGLKAAAHPLAGEEGSIGESPDPTLGCNSLLHLGSGFLAGRVTTWIPESSCRLRAAIAME